MFGVRLRRSCRYEKQLELEECTPCAEHGGGGNIKRTKGHGCGIGWLRLAAGGAPQARGTARTKILDYDVLRREEAVPLASRCPTSLGCYAGNPPLKLSLFDTRQCAEGHGWPAADDVCKKLIMHEQQP